MKVLAAGGFIAAAAAAVYFFGGQREADVFPMPVSDAYAKLIRPDFGALSEGQKALNTKLTATGNGFNKLTWTQAGDMARFDCKIELSPNAEDHQQTKVKVTCDGGGAGDGAAAGIVHNMHRNAVIERIDATLTGRAYDKARAQGSTAYRWPGDGVEGGYGQAVGQALRMDGEMRRDMAQIEKDHESARFNGDVESSSDYSESSDSSER